MNLNLKIKLDRTCGLVLCILIRPFVCFLSKLFLRRDHLLDQDKIHNIVIAKYVGLGSIIQSTRLIKYLKIEFPDSNITYITSKENYPICKTISEIDNILLFPDKLFDLYKLPVFLFKLWKMKIDVFFDLEIYSYFSTLITTLSFSKNRIGFVRHSAKIKRSLYSHIVFFNTRNHYSDNYISLGQVLSNKEDSSIELAYLNYPKVNLVAIDKDFINSAKPYVIFNVHASELAFERRWPLQYFWEVIISVKEDFNIVLTGTKKEQEYTRQLFEMFDDNSGIYNLAGKLSFNEYLLVMEKAFLIVTGDTGPMHIAYALRKPTVSLFGMSCPEHFGMETEINLILYSNVKCSPCIHEMDSTPCGGDNICMQKITPDLVLNSINKLKRNINYDR